MAEEPSPPSSELSDPPSIESDHEDDRLSTAIPSSRPSVDFTNIDADHLAAPPPKRRKTGNNNTSASHFDCGDSTQPAEPDWDTLSLSLSPDGLSSAPGSPSHDEWALREEAQTECLWRDCPFGIAGNNDDLVRHVQGTHGATGGPKRTKYVCEWGECQRKTSNHPSGYALKAHMRSHTKEKPYYCALPECDKAFTRSDALAKHMRTVHEPELPRGGAANAPDLPTPSSTSKPTSKNTKPKLTNGTPTTSLPTDPILPPTLDEDGQPVPPSPASDNITYIPAHHPITGQPGFMIHYPPDVQFTAWESSIPADQLMRLLRRQLHWALREGEKLGVEVEMLEGRKREEWGLKEILLEGVLEGEWARANGDGGEVGGWGKGVREAMERDVAPARGLTWVPKSPAWRHPPNSASRGRGDARQGAHLHDDNAMPDAHHQNTHNSHSNSNSNSNSQVATPAGMMEATPSPPPTGKSGGFDGDKDPYDNFVGDQLAHFAQLRAERERAKNLAQQSSMSQTQHTQQEAAEADAVGALMGMSGGGGRS